MLSSSSLKLFPACGKLPCIQHHQSRFEGSGNGRNPMSMGGIGNSQRGGGMDRRDWPDHDSFDAKRSRRF